MAVTRIVEFERDGLVFDVIDEGPIEGTAVILLHGFPERASSWRLVAPLLHEAGLRTLAVDQRGYSPRARPGRVRDYAAQHLADDIAVLAELLIAQGAQTPHLVGHDWGAAAAWTVATRRPDVIGSLTAVSVPHPAAFLKAIGTSRQLFKSWYFIPFNIPGLVPLAARRRGGPMDGALKASGMTRADVDRFHTEIVDYGALPYALRWYRAMLLADRGDLGTPITVPTTMVWSDGDSAIAISGVRGTADHVEADYRLVVVPGVSHWIPTQAPQPLAQAIIDRVTGP